MSVILPGLLGASSSWADTFTRLARPVRSGLGELQGGHSRLHKWRNGGLVFEPSQE
jgi:hypothetical protein